MARLVPVLQIIHELRSAGVNVDYHVLLDTPDSHWRKLPAEARERLLASAGAEEPAEAVRRVRVVKRRARPALAENVFLRIELESEGGDEDKPSLQNLLMYVPVSGDESRLIPVKENEAPEDDDMEGIEGFSLPESVFRESSFSQKKRTTLELLDEAWGGDAYALAYDGQFCTFRPPGDFIELERYWVDEPFSLVAILRNEHGELAYHVQEPRLSEYEKMLLLAINERLRDSLITDDEEPGDKPGHLARTVFGLLEKVGLRHERCSGYKLAYYVLRNYLGYGRLDAVMHDPHVEDISCNGPNAALFVAHGRHKNVQSTLVFGESELDVYTVKLAQLGGKLLSVAQPLVDATLPDGSRIQACLGHAVTAKGSAFTIRKFREDPLTCVDLIRSGAHTVDTMAMLWMAVELKRSLIVMGATASGKTTTLNCLSQFIPPTQKVVTIEDTREITLQHENWLAAVTRDGVSTGKDERIAMYDLLRAALRQRPEYLIVGEIRGEEGLTLFQAMSTGHTCFSTMHAGSVENAVHRLENPPIQVPRVMLTSLDFFLLQGHVDFNGKGHRRMLSITELNGIDAATRNLRTNDIYKWDGTQDVHQKVGDSQVLDEARLRQGWTRGRLQEEYDSRRRVLTGLVERKARHYREVASAVRTFYQARGLEAEPVKPTKVGGRKT